MPKNVLYICSQQSKFKGYKFFKMQELKRKQFRGIQDFKINISYSRILNDLVVTFKIYTIFLFNMLS